MMQPQSSQFRRFKKRTEDGLNYKDTSYRSLRLCIVGPDDKIYMRKGGRRRCVWGEIKLPGGGLWRIYAYSIDGGGSTFSLRTYVKDGTATLTEVKADISEVLQAIER